MHIGFKRILGAIGVALALAFIALFAHRAQVNRTSSTGTDELHSAPVLIPGIQEPAEMRVDPIPVVVLSPPERMLGDAMQRVGNKGGPAALLPALDRIIAKYPDYSDGYVMRLGAFCDSSDRVAILSNINNALRYVSNSRTGKNSIGSLLSVRAKIEHTNGDDPAAMEDLNKAIQANIADATQFVNSGTIAPEKNASACTWTQPEMDALVQRFPNDYRAYLLRGLYYGFFTQWDLDSLEPAIENLRKAGEMNVSSALPPFFSAHVRERAFSIKRLGMSDAQRQDLQHVLLTDLTAALALDPNLLPSLTDRAQV